MYVPYFGTRFFEDLLKKWYIRADVPLFRSFCRFYGTGLRYKCSGSHFEEGKLNHFARSNPTNSVKNQKKTVSRETAFVCDLLSVIDYSMIVETVPAPTVWPPSRIANLRPCSIAIGVISSTEIVTWSPGIHISVPSGRCATPVTSVVLK